MYTVKTISLDKLLEKVGADEVSLIKVDIEGGEEFILDDLHRISELHKIPVYVGMHYNWWKDKNLDRFKFLTESQKLLIKNLNPLASILLGNNTSTSIQELYAERIMRNEPFIYAKFGDGEYLAVKNESDPSCEKEMFSEECRRYLIENLRVPHNCDNTRYTKTLGRRVYESLDYFSKIENAFLGKWNEHNFVHKDFELMIKRPVQWEDYHLFIFRNAEEFKQRLLLYFSIKTCKKQKIYICNEKNKEWSKNLLQIDDFVTVHPSNWFETEYDSALNRVSSLVKDPDNCMIITSAGMGAKVLLMDLHKRFTNATFIDLGSAMDILFTGQRNRDYISMSPSDIDKCRRLLS
jgi:hypothetical protein